MNIYEAIRTLLHVVISVKKIISKINEKIQNCIMRKYIKETLGISCK